MNDETITLIVMAGTLAASAQLIVALPGIRQCERRGNYHWLCAERVQHQSTRQRGCVAGQLFGLRGVAFTHVGRPARQRVCAGGVLPLGPQAVYSKCQHRFNGTRRTTAHACR